MQKTVVILKPDALQRGLNVAISKMLDNAGLRLIKIKREVLSKEVLEIHYSHVKQKMIKENRVKDFDDLMNYMTSGDSVICLFEGRSAIEIMRDLCGATDPSVADPTSIRGKYGNDSYILAKAEGRSLKNLVHSSDSEESAEIEEKRFFN